jgi:cytochrome c oxidase cbb3-type subunit 2
VRLVRIVPIALLGVCATAFADENSGSELRGERVYRRACAACHGAAGDGDAPAATYLNPRPRDFTAGTFKFRSTPSGEPPTDQDLIRVVEKGVPSTTMPAWEGLLAERQISDVVAYIKSFSASFDGAEPAPIEIPEEPAVTQQTISDGKSVYVIMQCWSCHGTEGRGDGATADRLKDDWGQPIRPYDFTGGTYKAGGDSRDIYKTFETGLDGTPMPSYADAFLYGSDSFTDFGVFERTYPASDVDALRAYLQTLRTMDALLDLPDAELEAIIARRKWSLVHYVRSLSRERGWAYKLFVEDTEVTR